MNRQTLEQLYTAHQGKVSDRWSSYLVEYGRIFAEYRDKPIRLLEIGVQNGGSLEIWSKFFANAEKLVGCDINPDCARLRYEDSRITVVVGDANLDTIESIVLQYAPAFDVIIDDGSHRSSDIVKSFAKYFPHLKEGGTYVVEDLHCAYWAGYEGGLFDPFSSITFFKRLVDIVNHEHWGSTKFPSDILRGFFLKCDLKINEEVLKQIHSIEFINSMCVIRKDSSQCNSLGTRIISGLECSIVPMAVTLHSSPKETRNEADNIWTARMIPPDEDVLRLENELAKRDETILRLTALKDDELAKRDETILSLNALKDEILNSKSWRITRPLRFFMHFLKKSKRKFGI